MCAHVCVPCRYAGILSAVGIHLADIVQEAQEPTATQLGPDSLPDLQARLQGLAATAVGQLQAQGFDEAHIGVENFLNLRWVDVGVGRGKDRKVVLALGHTFGRQ
jgi:N-methylhydantoinase A/oxoprolinase/acetone carboxylase beta subunit